MIAVASDYCTKKSDEPKSVTFTVRRIRRIASRFDAANIRIIYLTTKDMDRKSKNVYENYLEQLSIRCALLTCHWLSEDNCKNARKRSDGAANNRKPQDGRVPSLLAPRRLVPTAAAQDTPSGGYVVAIVRLIKHALFHKEGEHFVLVMYKSVRDDG